MNQLDIPSESSEYELDLQTKAELNEEFINEFYGGIPEDVYSVEKPVEPTRDTFDEEEEEYLNQLTNPETPELEEEEDGKVKTIKKARYALSPVRMALPKEIEVAAVPGTSTDYRNFIQKESSESVEAFRVRSRIADILAAIEIPRGKGMVSLDTPTIVLFSRMITNKLWYGVEYNSEQENLLQAVVQYAPEIKF